MLVGFFGEESARLWRMKLSLFLSVVRLFLNWASLGALLRRRSEFTCRLQAGRPMRAGTA